MTMADLIALGAPRLPRGRFYRIRRDAMGQGVVQIREDRRRFGSRLIMRDYLRPEPYQDADGALVDACRRLADQTADHDLFDFWIGDHR